MNGDFVQLQYHILPVKVALTEEEQCQGLMGCKWPPPNLIFPFKDAKIRSFWMKDTPSPLDIIFARNEEIIKICQGKPFDLNHISSNYPINLVAEFPLGTVERLKICKGQLIRPIFSRQSLVKKILVAQKSA